MAQYNIVSYDIDKNINNLYNKPKNNNTKNPLSILVFDLSNINKTVKVKKLINIILNYNVDIITLFNTNKKLYKILLNDLGPVYHIINTYETYKYDSGIIFMCKTCLFEIIDTINFNFNFPKHTNKYIFICSIKNDYFGVLRFFNVFLDRINNEVLNTQLIGLMDTYKKIKNTKYKYDIFEDYIIGNFYNISNNILYNIGFTDIWVLYGCPYSIKYTYNTHTNKIANKKGDGSQCGRYDRIFIKNSQIIIDVIKLLGTQTLINENYGIYTRLLI